MRDRASVNEAVLSTVAIICTLILDIGCFSHTLHQEGKKFVTEMLTAIANNWISLFSHTQRRTILESPHWTKEVMRDDLFL